MRSEEDAVVEDYASSLEDLTFNSKPLINVLTMLAEENSQYAASITSLIETRIRTVVQSLKLPSLYLLDSIIKNVGGAYLQLIAHHLVRVFVSVFEKADEKVRKDLYKLRNTWPQYFSNKNLYELDVRVRSIDPGWPVIAPPPPPSPSIHVNPKFLQKKGDEIAAAVPTELPTSKSNEKQVLLDQQKRLLELQKLQEEQLRLTEQEIQEHQLKRDLILRKQVQERKALLTQQQQQIIKMRLEVGVEDMSREVNTSPVVSVVPIAPVASVAEPTRSSPNIAPSRDPRLRQREQTPKENLPKPLPQVGKSDIKVEITPDHQRSVRLEHVAKSERDGTPPREKAENMVQTNEQVRVRPLSHQSVEHRLPPQHTFKDENVKREPVWNRLEGSAPHQSQALMPVQDFPGLPTALRVTTTTAESVQRMVHQETPPKPIRQHEVARENHREREGNRKYENVKREPVWDRFEGSANPSLEVIPFQDSRDQPAPLRITTTTAESFQRKVHQDVPPKPIGKHQVARETPREREPSQYSGPNHEQSHGMPIENRKRSRSSSPEHSEKWKHGRNEGSRREEQNRPRTWQKTRRSSLDGQEEAVVDRIQAPRGEGRGFRGRGRGRGRGRENVRDERNRDFNDRYESKRKDIERDVGRGQRGRDSRDIKPKLRFKKHSKEERPGDNKVKSIPPSKSGGRGSGRFVGKGNAGLSGRKLSPESSVKEGPPVKRSRTLPDNELKEIRVRGSDSPIPTGHGSTSMNAIAEQIRDIREHTGMGQPIPPQSVEECDVPHELSLEHREVILKEAENRLLAGVITQEQYLELIDKLVEFYELQRQQEQDNQLQMQPQMHGEGEQLDFTEHVVDVRPPARLDQPIQRAEEQTNTVLHSRNEDSQLRPSEGQIKTTIRLDQPTKKAEVKPNLNKGKSTAKRTRSEPLLPSGDVRPPARLDQPVFNPETSALHTERRPSEEETKVISPIGDLRLPTRLDQPIFKDSDRRPERRVSEEEFRVNSPVGEIRLPARLDQPIFKGEDHPSHLERRSSKDGSPVEIRPPARLDQPLFKDQDSAIRIERRGSDDGSKLTPPREIRPPARLHQLCEMSVHEQRMSRGADVKGKRPKKEQMKKKSKSFKALQSPEVGPAIDTALVKSPTFGEIRIPARLDQPVVKLREEPPEDDNDLQIEVQNEKTGTQDKKGPPKRGRRRKRGRQGRNYRKPSQQEEDSHMKDDNGNNAPRDAGSKQQSEQSHVSALAGPSRNDRQSSEERTLSNELPNPGGPHRKGKRAVGTPAPLDGQRGKRTQMAKSAVQKEVIPEGVNRNDKQLKGGPLKGGPLELEGIARGGRREVLPVDPAMRRDNFSLEREGLRRDGPPNFEGPQRRNGPPVDPAMRPDHPPFEGEGPRRGGPPEFVGQHRREGPPIDPTLRRDRPPFEGGRPRRGGQPEFEGPPRHEGPPLDPAMRPDRPPFEGEAPRSGGPPEFVGQHRREGPPIDPTMRRDRPPFEGEGLRIGGPHRREGPPMEQNMRRDHPPFEGEEPRRLGPLELEGPHRHKGPPMDLTLRRDRPPFEGEEPRRGGPPEFEGSLAMRRDRPPFEGEGPRRGGPPEFEGPHRREGPPMDPTKRQDRPPFEGEGPRRGGPPEFEGPHRREGPPMDPTLRRDRPPFEGDEPRRGGPPEFEGPPAKRRDRPPFEGEGPRRGGPPEFEGPHRREGPPMDSTLRRDRPPFEGEEPRRGGPPGFEGPFRGDFEVPQRREPDPAMRRDHPHFEGPPRGGPQRRGEPPKGRVQDPQFEARPRHEGPPRRGGPPFEGPHPLDRPVDHPGIREGRFDDIPPMEEPPAGGMRFRDNRNRRGRRRGGQMRVESHPFEGPFEDPPRQPFDEPMMRDIHQRDVHPRDWHPMDRGHGGSDRRFEVHPHDIDRPRFDPPGMDREHQGPPREMVPWHGDRHLVGRHSPVPLMDVGSHPEENRGPPMHGVQPDPDRHHPEAFGHGRPMEIPRDVHEPIGHLPPLITDSPTRDGPPGPPPPPTPTRMEKERVDDIFKRLCQLGVIKKVTQEQEPPPRLGTPPVPQPGPPVQGGPPPPMSHPPAAPPVAGPPQSSAMPLTQQLLQQMLVKSKEAAAKIPQINFDPEDLKKRYVGIIKLIYDGTQCSSCGLRFPLEEAALYREHLDWHFRRNRREKDGRRVAHRQWYIPLQDWLDYEEITDPEEKAHSSFFDMKKSDDKGATSSSMESSSCPVLSSDGEAESSCDICCETFEQFWEEGNEEWHYKDAVRLDGKTYHKLCYQDAKRSVEETEEKTVQEPSDENSSEEDEIGGTPQIKEEEEDTENTEPIPIANTSEIKTEHVKENGDGGRENSDAQSSTQRMETERVKEEEDGRVEDSDALSSGENTQRVKTENVRDEGGDRNEDSVAQSGGENIQMETEHAKEEGDCRREESESQSSGENIQQIKTERVKDEVDDRIEDSDAQSSGENTQHIKEEVDQQTENSEVRNDRENIEETKVEQVKVEVQDQSESEVHIDRENTQQMKVEQVEGDGQGESENRDSENEHVTIEQIKPDAEKTKQDVEDDSSREDKKGKDNEDVASSGDSQIGAGEAKDTTLCVTKSSNQEREGETSGKDALDKESQSEVVDKESEREVTTDVLDNKSESEVI